MSLFQPKISIIIATKNSASLLQETLQSLSLQQYSNVEVVVIDGYSHDDTLDILHANQHLITAFTSEKDNGISDAFNKGLRLARGEYINFQGAGDTLASPHCLQELFSDLDNSYQLICGKVLRVKEDGKTPLWVAPRKNGKFNAHSLLWKMSLPHQGLFTHRSYFEKWGEFNQQMTYAMDYELLLRSYHQFPKTIVKDILISHWRSGGIGQGRIFEIFKEYHHIKALHNVANPWLLWMINKLNYIKYALKIKLLRKSY